MQPLELGVGHVLVDVDDAAAFGAHLAHRIEHARVVAAVGARLHEHEALEPEAARQREIVLERRERRRIAQVAAVRIARGRAEHMEVAITGEQPAL